jgi:hypothetical protein
MICDKCQNEKDVRRMCRECGLYVMQERLYELIEYGGNCSEPYQINPRCSCFSCPFFYEEYRYGMNCESLNLSDTTKAAQRLLCKLSADAIILGSLGVNRNNT